GRAYEAGPNGHTQAPAHRPGEMLGLVEAAAAAPRRRRRGPGHRVDRTGKVGLQAPHEGRAQDREGRPDVAVLHPGQGLPHRTLVAEGGRPPVEPRRWWRLSRRPGPGEAGGAERPGRGAAPDAAGREQTVEERAEHLHAPDGTEWV